MSLAFSPPFLFFAPVDRWLDVHDPIVVFRLIETLSQG